MASGYEKKRWSGALVVLACLLIALAIFGAYRLANWIETGRREENRGTMSAGFGQLPTTEYQGETYELRPNLTTILLIGTDRGEEAPGAGYRDGGQADFLMLLVVDHRQKQISRLQIDRDTVADVTVLGTLGNEVGTRPMQICLSHGFGADDEARCRYTADAVSRLLQGMEIDSYVALDMGQIALLNRAMGGVTVSFDEDMTDVDPAFLPGEEIHLSDEQAERLLRARMGVSDGTNRSRMARQRLFLAAAADALALGIEEDADFPGKLLDEMGDALVTNLTRQRILYECGVAYGYTVLPIETPDGAYDKGDDGFTEFHADEDFILSWVVKTFFNKRA